MCILLNLPLQEIHANCLFIILREDPFTVSLNHTGFSDGSIADNNHFDGYFNLLFAQHLWMSAASTSYKNISEVPYENYYILQ